MPGFAVFFQAHDFCFAVRIETQHGRGHAGADGQDVPDVEGCDVSDKEINVFGAIDVAALANGVGGASFVGLGAKAVGGFDLYAEEAVSVVENEVVALGVSPGLGDPKPRELALWRKAASERSPARLVLRNLLGLRDLGFIWAP